MKRLFFITLKVLAAFFFFLYLIIWLISPIVSSYFIEKNIEQYELALSESSSIPYNPFISQVKIENFDLTKASKPVFSIEKLTVELNLLQLLFQELHIKSIIGEGINGQLVMNDDNISVAGVVIPKSSSQSESDKPEKPTTEPSDNKPALLLNKKLFITKIINRLTV